MGADAAIDLLSIANDRGGDQHCDKAAVHPSSSFEPLVAQLHTFAEGLLDRLQRAGVPTRFFQLEATETVFLGRGAEHVARALKLLGAAGVRIGLDDFGTGYASLSHLKQLPVNSIKIDRSFVQDMALDPHNEAIIRSIIGLGDSLGLDVIAEGIETEAQAAHLCRLGCHYGQGFLYSKAVAAARVPQFLNLYAA